MKFENVFFQFMSNTNTVAYEISNDFQPDGISKVDYSILEALYYEEYMTLKSMSASVAVSMYKTRQSIQQLVLDGYAEAGKDPNDKRRKQYAITRKGKLKLDECFFQILKDIQLRYKDLSQEQQTNLIECFSYISKIMYKM